MNKFPILIGVMLTAIVLVLGDALAVPVTQGNSDCRAWGGTMRWNWDLSRSCPWCNTTCFGCAGGAASQCFYIICDLKACDEIIFSKRPNKPARVRYMR
jgi:hypothetical protein